MRSKIAVAALVMIIALFGATPINANTIAAYLFETGPAGAIAIKARTAM